MLVNEKRSKAAPEREPLTTIAAAPEGYRPLLTKVNNYDTTAVGATVAAEVPVPSRVASEPGRPAEDTSRRPVLPAGVGPMIDVQRGEARVPYLAGIAAHDECGGVLSTDFKSLPARVIPPALKAEKGSFQKNTSSP